MKVDELGLTENDYEKVDVNSSRWLDLTDLRNEVWRDVKGFEGLYEVSNYGRVKSLDRTHIVYNRMGNTGKYKKIKEHILLQYKTKKGYHLVWLYKNGIRKGISVHILVTNAFIPKDTITDTVNHIKPITKKLCDNRLFNLEYMSLRNNILDSVNRGTHKCFEKGEKHPCSKSVIQYDLDMNFVKQWYCITSAAEETNINRTCISNVCKGTQKTAGGYKWRYGIYENNFE